MGIVTMSVMSIRHGGYKQFCINHSWTYEMITLIIEYSLVLKQY